MICFVFAHIPTFYFVLFYFICFSFLVSRAKSFIYMKLYFSCFFFSKRKCVTITMRSECDAIQMQKVFFFRFFFILFIYVCIYLSDGIALQPVDDLNKSNERFIVLKDFLSVWWLYNECYIFLHLNTEHWTL